jgi:hypothetical protein
MFAEEDIARASQVRPLSAVEDVDVTLIGHATGEDKRPEPRLPLLATFVVIFSTVLLSAPKGAVLETAISAANSAKQFWSKREDPAATKAITQGGVDINANNSNVQNVQVINNGGQVSVSTAKK